MIVLDSSVVAKAFLDEKETKEVLELLADRQEKVVPDWMYVEIANVLATKSVITSGGMKEGLELLYGLDFVIERVSKDLLTEAAVLAKEIGVSVYDMMYALLAKKLGGKLITADKKFAKKVGWELIQVI